MICPKCMNKVHALSSRCEHCTEDYGTGNLWASNIGGVVLILVFLIVLGALS
jgi:uncharacterized OB-fold protein